MSTSPRDSFDGDLKHKQEVEHLEHDDTKFNKKVVSDDVYHFGKMSEEDLEARRKKLVRLVDLRLMPLMTLMYFLNFVDRSNLANARLGSLEADLGMSGNDFQTVGHEILLVDPQTPAHDILLRFPGHLGAICWLHSVCLVLRLLGPYAHHTDTAGKPFPHKLSARSHHGNSWSNLSPDFRVQWCGIAADRLPPSRPALCLPPVPPSKTKVKPSLALPSAMMLWGLVSLLTAWVQNYAGLIAVRFMLGIVEGA